MCGIAGVVGTRNMDAARQAVDRMTCALERRGPDGAGIESWTEATLGHRRLAIFDLSQAGHQPMLTVDRTLGVVFNGAIYNFAELRRELERDGYVFNSQTDTEVLLHGYRAWGINKLVERLRGMFAFGLWDDTARKLFLVRDRLGVKPLCVATKPDGTLAFASTPRALRASGFADEINDSAMLEFLEFGFVTDAHSIYQGVTKVEAATIIEWDGATRTSQTRRYWTSPEVSENKNIRFEEAVEETERLFLRAVERRLQADVPVGALLSGGVDSSLVCWAITKLGGDVTAYTIGTPNDPLDESNDARITAERLGIKQQILNVSDDDTPDVEELVAAFPEPFSVASALGMLRLSRAFASSATVMLTGDGGDDVFLGYPEHLNFYTAQQIARSLPAPAAALWSKLSSQLPRNGKSSGKVKRALSFLDYTTGGLAAIARVRAGLPFYEANDLLGTRLTGKSLPHREMTRSFDSSRNLLRDFLRYDYTRRFTGEYLPKVDGATMHYAVEARSPFLDQELWEYAASLPFEVRLHKRTLKAVLREIARRRVSVEVATGHKRGFGVPVERWMAGQWRAKFEAVMRDSVLEREGWINSAQVLKRFEQATSEGAVPTQLWYIYVLETWLRHERETHRADAQVSSTRSLHQLAV